MARVKNCLFFFFRNFLLADVLAESILQQALIQPSTCSLAKGPWESLEPQHFFKMDDSRSLDLNKALSVSLESRLRGQGPVQ